MNSAQYRQEVERLLGEISAGSEHLLRLDVAGVRGAEIAEEQQRLDETRRRLAELTAVV